MIGVFDSGLGGLSALKVLAEVMPKESFVYFGDTGRVPYGTRSAECIRAYAEEDLAFLLTFSPRAVLVACGTVSAVALERLKARSPVPLFGVTQSGAAAALRASKNRRIGIIGTAATVTSGVYETLLRAEAPDVVCRSVACPLFVPLIESGLLAAEEIADALCRRYLSPLREEGIDTLILGCTHYPLLQAQIAAVLPDVTLINVGAEGALSLAAQLWEGAAITEVPLPKDRVQCYVSDDPHIFEAESARFFGSPLSAVQISLSSRLMR